MNISKPLAAMTIFMAALCDPISAQANDTFASRPVVASAGGTASGNNLNATEKTGEPHHAGEAGGRSVCWSWTPAVQVVPVGGKYYFCFSGSPFASELLTPLAQTVDSRPPSRWPLSSLHH